MADLKISALPASTTPLAGTEVLPIVQSGATKQVSVANLTAGRAISATQLTLTAGNVIPANGYGIDFSATPGTGTSELFSDYEEGTYTATLTPASGSITVNSSYNTLGYTRIGRIVYVHGYITASAISSPTGELRLNLPFNTCATTQVGQRGSWGTGAISIAGSASSVTNGFQITWSDNKSYAVIALATGNATADASAQILGGGNTDIRIGFCYPCLA